MGRLRPLDGVRALAAFSVLCYHVWFFAGADGFGNPVVDVLFSRLQLGLVAFFVLSGFLLYRPFVAASLAGNAAPGLRDYARSRLLRIVPAYYAVLVFAAAVDGGFGASDLLLNATFQQSLLGADHWIVVPTWSLCVEMQFYAILPLLALVADRLADRSAGGRARAHLRFLLMLGLVALVLRSTLAVPLPSTLFRYLLAFLPGMLLALAYEWQKQKGRPRPSGRRLALAGAALAVATFALTDHLFICRELLAALAIALLLASFLLGNPESLLARVLGSRPLVALGTVSYGVFLWHSPLQHVIAFRATGVVSLLVAVILLSAVTTLTAVASWMLVERHALRLRRRRPVLRPATAT